MPRTIIVIDTETSGLSAEAEIVELAQQVVAEGADGWYVTRRRLTCLYSTSAPLSAEVRAIHHIDNSDLPFAYKFSDWGHAQWSEIGQGETAYCAHNADYDRPLLGRLAAGAPWICSLKCALRLWPDAPSHSNGALHYWLADQGKWPRDYERTLGEPPHRAGPDAYKTAYLLVTMLREVPLETLLQWSAEPKQLVKMPLGKHRGARFDALPLDYLQWAARSDMGVDIKAACRQELTRRADVRAPKPPGVTSP